MGNIKLGARRLPAVCSRIAEPTHWREPTGAFLVDCTYHSLKFSKYAVVVKGKVKEGEKKRGLLRK